MVNAIALPARRSGDGTSGGRIAKGSTAAFGRAALVVAAVLILDQLAKHAVVSGIPVGVERRLLPLVQLVDVRNKGVAFGFFSGGGALVLVAIR